MSSISVFYPRIRLMLTDYNHPFNTHNLCTLAIFQYFGFIFMSSLDIHSNKSEYVH